MYDKESRERERGKREKERRKEKEKEREIVVHLPFDHKFKSIKLHNYIQTCLAL